MSINTCSGAISLFRDFENEAAQFYRKLAERFDSGKDLFLSFAAENGKFVKQVERAYYGVITDALEGCFAFDLNPQAFELKTAVSEGATYPEAIRQAIAMEDKMLSFLQVAAEQSKHLMADVPRSFTLVAKKRNERIPKLKALLE
jgi:rubrerythrin